MSEEVQKLRGRILRLLQSSTSVVPNMVGFGMELTSCVVSTHRQVVACCDMQRGCYSFSLIKEGCFIHLSSLSIPFNEFEKLIHKDDISHFRHAQLASYAYIEMQEDDLPFRFMLQFECRMLYAGTYRRTFFRYLFWEYDCYGYHPILTLSLQIVPFCNQNVTHRGVYLVNRKGGEVAYRTCYSLTKRDQEVLSLIAKRCSSSVIAEQLHISEYTVRAHRRSIFTKIGCRSEIESVLYASMLGLLSD
ncbi:response regulator transcription factor [Alistipes sp. ZOR0009]|uniref:response regulator transcription factor n=1 Tax=Alistipes sp. ZOR0009 TaxID=1339253 RepID=UPI000645A59D|nr:LuxR C-terminal-related transcriptional regulator [Alistipes sp. ZOR0009]